MTCDGIADTLRRDHIADADCAHVDHEDVDVASDHKSSGGPHEHEHADETAKTRTKLG